MAIAVPTTLLQYQVPSGRVLYVTGIDLDGVGYTDNGALILPTVSSPDLITLSVDVDGNTMPWTQNLVVSQDRPSLETHIIAGAGQTVTVRAVGITVLSTGIPANADGYMFNCRMRGDVLLSNNQPVPYTATQPREQLGVLEQRGEHIPHHTPRDDFPHKKRKKHLTPQEQIIRAAYKAHGGK